jgi:type I restriction enzyme S subunit
MAGDWEWVTLGDVVINHDARRIPVREADRKLGKYPYYGASGIVDYIDDYIFDGEYLLVAEDGENLRTRQTPIAFMANGQFWVNNHAHILQGSAKTLTRFLRYVLASADVQPFLTGAVMPKLTQANLHRIPVLLPPKTEQEDIVALLGAIDDKIELNRAMAETLEAMARALFRSWFVDFEPVRAKAAGRSTGLPDDLTALFPDRFGDLAAPLGWKLVTLDNLVELAYGKALPADKRINGSVPVFGSNGQVGVHNHALVPGSGIVVGRKGNPGTVTYVPSDFFCIDTTFYVLRRNADLPISYLWLLLVSESESYRLYYALTDCRA